MSVTQRFKDAVLSGAHVEYYADVVLGNKDTFRLTEENFAQDGCEIVTVCSSSLPIGNVVSKYITLTILNENDQFRNVYFMNAQIALKCKVEFDDGTAETESLGIYKVTDPEEYGATITLTGYDKIIDFDVNYTEKIGGQKLIDVVKNICIQQSVLLDEDSIDINRDYVLQNYDGTMTMRQLLGWCACLSASNAVLKDNTIRFQKFLSVKENIDCGTFAYNDIDTYDGGTFNPWNDGSSVDGGEWMAQYTFDDITNAKKATEYSNITALTVTRGDGEYGIGTDASLTIRLECPLFGDTNEAIQKSMRPVWNELRNITVLPFSIDVPNFPVIDFMGLVSFNYKDVYFNSRAMNITTNFNGYTTISNTLEYPKRIGSRYYSSDSAVNRDLQTAKRETLTMAQRNQDYLAGLIANSLGLFPSSETTENGGTILYFHDRPDRKNSTIIWRFAENGFFVSEDGGKTWIAGIDSYGNATVNILSAVGIRFDWARGGTIVLGGSYNQNGSLEVLDGSGLPVIDIDNSGITTYGTNSKMSTVEYGSFSVKNSYVNGEITFDNRTGTMGGNTNGVLLNVEKYEQDSLFNGTHFVVRLQDTEGKSKDIFYVSRNINQQIETTTSLGKTKVHADVMADGDMLVSGRVSCGGGLSVFGSKSRTVDTKSYGLRDMYAYETATPYFGDIGVGCTDENGECIIFIDDIVRETVSDVEYVVFLQPEGDGKVWIEKKGYDYFVVNGTADLRFAWELKASQKYYENTRREQFDTDMPESGMDHGYDIEFEKLLAELEDYDYEITQ